MAAARFSVGSTFQSYEKFEEELNVYKTTSFSEYFIKDCRTLVAAKKRYPHRVEKAKVELKYYFIKLACVHGGTYRRKTIGERNASSMRRGCNAYIYVRLSDDGMNLVITEMNENHNHELCPELFTFYPRQRRLAPDVQQEVLDLLELKANKKLIQEKYTSETEKKITLRDLSNLQAKGNAKQPSFEDMVKSLQHDYNCTIKVMLDEAQDLRAVYIQDAKMKKEFEYFPEVLFADCTYKLTDLRTPIFILMTENGNGESCVVAAGVFVTEEKDVYQWFMETFKTENPAAVNTKIMMTDKDMTERLVFKDVLPTVKLRICLFHTLKIFRREISEQAMGLSSLEVFQIRLLLQNMCYVSSLEEYQDLYNQLKDISPERVIRYFDANWKDIIEEWTGVSDFQGDTLFNRTNNRVESFNAKLKSVVSHFTSLDKFLKHFFAVIKCLRLEREASAAKVLSRFTTQPFRSDDERMYCSYVTPYAFQLLEKQFDSLSLVAEDSLIKYSTTDTSCKCSFHVSLHLPCKHILKYRLDSNISMYDSSLVSHRWSRNYFAQCQNREPERQVMQHCTVDVVARRVVTTQQKFRKAVVVTNKLATLISESSKSELRLKLLQKIYDKWASGIEVELQMDEHDSAHSIAESDQLTPAVGTDEVVPLNDLGSYATVEIDLQETPTESRPADNEKFNISAQAEVDHNYASIHTHARPEDDNIASTVPETSNTVHISLKDIRLPSKVKVRGRPKGSTITAIGLPRTQKGKKKAFPKKNHQEKMYIILSWFVSEEVILKVKNGYLIAESDIECRPEAIHCGAVDGNVDLFIVRPFFTADGWTMLLNVVENKKQSNVWICNKCNQNVSDNSICCDSCLSWYHFKCVAIKNAPKRGWFCIFCK